MLFLYLALYLSNLTLLLLIFWFSANFSLSISKLFPLSTEGRKLFSRQSFPLKIPSCQSRSLCCYASQLWTYLNNLKRFYYFSRVILIDLLYIITSTKTPLIWTVVPLSTVQKTDAIIVKQNKFFWKMFWMLV